jgi:serine/threonine protein kinase
VCVHVWCMCVRMCVRVRGCVCMCVGLQGGLRLSSVLSILVQAVAGLLHLHSLGILHRDLRADNLLLDGLDPLHARLADLGLSHLLSPFARGGAAAVSASRVTSLLRGSAATGPLQVRATKHEPGGWAAG